jgi:hypothetical protein
MEITQPKKYIKEKMQEKVEIPVAKGKETTYPFQWLVFKPQQHAIEPFKKNESSRNANTERK